MYASDKNNRRRKAKFIFLSKTKEMGENVDLLDLFGEENTGENSENLKETSFDADASSTVNIHIVRNAGVRLHGFALLDQKYLKPFFLRKFTDEVKIILFWGKTHILFGLF